MQQALEDEVSEFLGSERYRAWCERRLDRHDLVYCSLDAIYLKLRPDDEPAEGVLVAWA
jgi:transposase-like protein